jgi:hypothetical protein
MEMKTSLRTTASAVALSLWIVALASSPATALEVVLDAGTGGTQTFTDDDANGIIEFDTTIGGVLEAQGSAKEIIEGINAKLTLAPLAPAPTAIFRNVSANPETFTVTVKSSSAAVTFGPPLGWNLFYYGEILDLVDGVVDVPSHSVDAFVAGGTIPIAALLGAPATEPSPIALESNGLVADASANDGWIVWTFSLGPNDEIRLPSDGGFDGDSIQLNLFNGSQKCVDKMNNGATKVVKVAQKIDAKCLKPVPGVVTPCVDAPGDAKTVKQQRKVVDNFTSQCAPPLAWGVNPLNCCYGGGTNDGDICTDSSECTGGTCAAGACIAEAAEDAANALTHDLYGADVVAAADAKARKCQNAVSKAAGNLLAEHWKTFRLCKRDQFSTIADSADLRATCLEPQPDPKGKIAKRGQKLTLAVNKKCLDKGITGLGGTFAGVCASVADSELSTCVAERARCRFCRAANVADAIVPPTDCDAFDDALANESCVP